MDNAALEALVTSYCDAWNERDAARRDAMLRDAWADGGTYTDPTAHAAGSAELSAHIGRVQARTPGARIVRTSKVDAHRGVLRFSFARVAASGETLREGVDFGELAGDGKLRRIVGFFGPLEPM